MKNFQVSANSLRQVRNVFQTQYHRGPGSNGLCAKPSIIPAQLTKGVHRKASNALTMEISTTLPQVAEVTTAPAERSAEALSLAVALETSGLVHFVVRRAAETGTAVASRDHTIVYKGTREINGTSSPSSPPQPQLSQGDGVAVVETVEGLEPNATYEVQHRGHQVSLLMIEFNI